MFRTAGIGIDIFPLTTRMLFGIIHCWWHWRRTRDTKKCELTLFVHQRPPACPPPFAAQAINVVSVLWLKLATGDLCLFWTNLIRILISNADPIAGCWYVGTDGKRVHILQYTGELKTSI
jgi:hypothetical protein